MRTIVIPKKKKRMKNQNRSNHPSNRRMKASRAHSLPRMKLHAKPRFGHHGFFSLASFLNLFFFSQMAEIEKKAKSLPGENMAVAAWSAGPGVILTSASPLIWSKTELSVPCEECDAQAVAPVIKVSAFGLELYYCPAHHPKLLL